MRQSLFRWQMLFIVVCLPATARAGDYEFQVQFTEKVHSRPFTGRVYLFFAKQSGREPRTGPNWFKPEPMVALDVENWKPGETLALGTKSESMLLAFPQALKKLDLAEYSVQAVARFNPFERNVGTGPGNGYSLVAKVPAADSPEKVPALTIDKLVPAQVFPENKWCKLLAVNSPLLSTFYCKGMLTQGAVILPASYYDQPDRRYPVMFTIPGFGGTHFHAITNEPIKESNAEGVEFLRVILDPSSPYGHHVFADSANNGAVGTALVEEFIPELDRQYRTVAQPTARFLTGHSSGGWSSLWLQVTYPDTFGGTWSTSPDPVDFRDFQRINLYQPGENMYRDSEGNRRPIARIGDKPALWYDDFDHMEEVLGHGGQLHSFEAVFSPKGPDGRPVRVWDRQTGAVDPAAARQWEKYDIRLVLESNWRELKPKLSGKLHVIMGDADTFYLEGATGLLKASLEKLGSDAVVELVPGKDHGTLLTQGLRNRLRSEMTEQFLKHHPAR